MNWIQKLIKGTQARIEHTVEIIAGIFRGKPDIAEPVEQPPKPEITDETRQVYDPDEFLPYEEDTGEPDEEPEDIEEERNQATIDEDTGLDVIEPGKDTRGPFATFAEAAAYADEIPVPTIVGKTPYGLYIVKVVYP